jgi:hypothetical protein
VGGALAYCMQRVGRASRHCSCASHPLRLTLRSHAARVTQLR